MTVQEAKEILGSGNIITANCRSISITNKARDIAIECMEKQIPKKPIGIHTDYKCSVCGRRVRSGKGSSSRQRDNFCQRCGQRISWTEEGES